MGAHLHPDVSLHQSNGQEVDNDSKSSEELKLGGFGIEELHDAALRFRLFTIPFGTFLMNNHSSWTERKPGNQPSH